MVDRLSDGQVAQAETVSQGHPFDAETPGCLGQQPDHPMRITALQVRDALANVQVAACRQVDVTGNRGDLGQARGGLIEPAGLDQAARENQQAMAQLRGITEVSSHFDTALRGVDRRGEMPLISWLAAYPAPDAHVPVGRARCYGDGTDLTMVTFGNGLRMSLRVTRRLAVGESERGWSTCAGWPRCHPMTCCARLG